MRARSSRRSWSSSRTGGHTLYGRQSDLSAVAQRANAEACPPFQAAISDRWWARREVRLCLPTLFSLHPPQRHPQSVPRLRDRPHLPIRLVAGLQRDAQILQEMPCEAFCLHIGEVQAEAHMRAAAERYPGETMTVTLRLVGESRGIELLRLRPDIGHVVAEQRGDAHHG